MTDAQPEDQIDTNDDLLDSDVPASVPVETGHAAVDEVLRSLSALDGTPVDEHVAVFERSHEQLRRTLSGAGDDQA
ncbi:MAG: hypothetical protein JWQ32_3491 [Marmoricola sp.]|nr:hypothetical protein [Marmoricola sp.]